MNFQVGDVLSPRYDMVLVAMSYVISVLGSFAALAHTQHLYRRDGSINTSMAIGAAVALGGVGVWSMHFIGMMGYRLPLPVQYDGLLTLLSLLAAMVIAGIALLLAGRGGQFNKPGWLAASILAGVGVCVMHYMGMYAMNLRADMSLDTGVVLLSFAIAVTASAAALWLAFHVRRFWHRVVASLVMGLAVCAMHYTGMQAAEFICVASTSEPLWAIGGIYLPPMVFSVVGVVLVYLLWNVLAPQETAPARKRTARGAMGTQHSVL
ncbi:MHYT domain-containing protein [Hydrogenophaga sp. BPS33]|uniref:MHYT domain-containing protein n=1 Tax=Hydrogenophaga sp. BPS33 TaxID=2651974 RepID=UPI00131F9AAA|nr:MHYT domain-containing protein [Hydrogenophaga sp. BPS33]QHE84535.1 histidine kinase [Hydrogenophaga sp. BPS33]